MAGKVPGTFKSDPGRVVRDRSRDGQFVEDGIRHAGALYAARYLLGQCTVLVSLDPVGPKREGRWHLSIAHHSRYPTWDEIKAARYTAPELADVPLMAQLLPLVKDESGWVNAHENTFHLHEIKENPHG